MEKSLHTSLLGHMLVRKSDEAHAEIMAVWIDGNGNVAVLVRIIESGQFKPLLLPDLEWRSFQSV